MKTDLLNRITLSECSKLTEAEILLRNLPQDNTAGHVNAILDKINAGIARVIELRKDGRKIGFFVFEVYGNEFWILAMNATQQTKIFETVLSHVQQMAFERKCSKLCFKTVRAGLIMSAMKNGFYISSVELHSNL